MKEEKGKKFELNTKMLENFDSIMSTKLDEIEELKVTSLDQGSKLLNIISLCANVKTLILEGDQRLNTNDVLANIFKPEMLEDLVLNNVKLPTVDVLKRYTNLKKVVLENIRFGNSQSFFEGIVHPDAIERIEISHTDWQKASIDCLKPFVNCKSLKLEDLRNAEIRDLEFLKENKRLEKLEILENAIPFTELEHLIYCKCTKNLSIAITDSKGKIIPNCQFKVKANSSEITIPANDWELISKNVSLYEIGKINLMVQEFLQNDECLEFFKNFKCNMRIILSDFACLSTTQAKKLKEEWKLKNIEFLSSKNDTKKFKIEDYIEVRKEIEETLQKVSNLEASGIEKFLQIYQHLGHEFQIVEEKSDFKNKTCTTLQICELLQNCLKCVGISSHIIFGEELENEKKHYWNQVELEGKWYYVDLSLDVPNIKKNKAEYCLLGETEFFETHRPKSGKNHYCAESFNPKLIHVFFKTGLLKERLLVSYLEIMLEKIRKLFRWGKKQDVLALPEVEEEKKE